MSRGVGSEASDCGCRAVSVGVANRAFRGARVGRKSHANLEENDGNGGCGALTGATRVGRLTNETFSAASVRSGSNPATAPKLTVVRRDASSWFRRGKGIFAGAFHRPSQRGHVREPASRN